jgi:hypothetical protein
MFSVDTTERNQFLDKWLSDLEGYYAKRHRQLDLEYQRDRERIYKIWSDETSEDAISESNEDKADEKPSPTATVGVHTTPQESVSTPIRESAPKPNGVYGDLTRRQIVWKIIPEFHGEPFKVSDVREKYLEKYLQTEPPNFTQALSNLLKRMADKDEIGRRREGDSRKSPWIYFVKEGDEDEATLLKSGP